MMFPKSKLIRKQSFVFIEEAELPVIHCFLKELWHIAQQRHWSVIVEKFWVIILKQRYHIGYFQFIRENTFL